MCEAADGGGHARGHNQGGSTNLVIAARTSPHRSGHSKGHSGKKSKGPIFVFNKKQPGIVVAQSFTQGCNKITTTTVNRKSKVLSRKTTGRRSGLPLAACPTTQATPRRAGVVAPPPPQITPQQAAAQAVAKLAFTAVAPGVGPNHSDNNLKDDQTGVSFDAPVGYPLWLWADGGDIAPRAVSDTEGGLAVAISMKLDQITWKMGDGTTLSCGVGTPWVKGVTTPGSKSPTCGHVYEQTGDYTVTATTHWAIHWTAGGQAGDIPYAISRSRPYAVGELQVIVQ